MSYTNIRTAQGDTRVEYAYYATSQESKDFDPEYDKLAIWDQLGKILDSQDNPFPRDDITTDDGVKITGVTPKDCIAIRKTLLMIEKPADRKVILDKIQKTSDGFKEILDYVRSN